MKREITPHAQPGDSSATKDEPRTQSKGGSEMPRRHNAACGATSCVKPDCRCHLQIRYCRASCGSVDGSPCPGARHRPLPVRCIRLFHTFPRPAAASARSTSGRLSGPIWLNKSGVFWVYSSDLIPNKSSTAPTRRWQPRHTAPRWTAWAVFNVIAPARPRGPRPRRRSPPRRARPRPSRRIAAVAAAAARRGRAARGPAP